MWKTREEMEDWADMHGYWHWKCRKCGMSGWTDTTPDCACLPEDPAPEDEDPGYAGERAEDDHESEDEQC